MRRAAASVVVALLAAVVGVALPGAASAAPAAAPVLGVEATGGVIDGGSGYAIVEGTLSCTEAVAVRVSGNAVQFSTGAFGMFDALVDCTPGAPVEWDAVLPQLSDAPFEPGELSASTRASVADAPVGAERSTTITLTFALAG